MPYDVLLFDLDDTLFDFEETEKHALGNTFHTFGLPNGLEAYRDTYRAISSVIWDDLEQGRITLEELKVERFRRLFTQHELQVDASHFGELYIENLGHESHMIDGVEEMIAQLTDYRKAILTNGFTIAQHARIAGSPLRDTFEAIIASEETGYKKPQPEIFEYTFQKLGITDPSRVLMIGDSLTSDIQGGINAGIDTCWFNPDRRENHTAIQPTYEIHSWAEFSLRRKKVTNN
ncbi:noncanonical pyrimidine nucleotidase, YjjG family [Sporosarcina sp. P16a]|uniref:YjjG family noncanonical pyrimidine nucleotidase n=1 Tax=unclassified Sporosarcina TaxID=2647733 RepID=UPI000C168369|nr:MULTISPECIES: YjjG family noncanonical pyrimidine nucleotidase [unclassified Sporosarcina]PIC65920.1 noncanonical pyrimidine nucleotidase, YjjG family [Sporosarcina sp. P16a]PIC91987.1 noncanonical pyrimidine nucleotidase, YjjG family [Sporosarcina sp. P25]